MGVKTRIPLRGPYFRFRRLRTLPSAHQPVELEVGTGSLAPPHVAVVPKLADQPAPCYSLLESGKTKSPTA
jgi:hypothetical protein